MIRGHRKEAKQRDEPKSKDRQPPPDRHRDRHGVGDRDCQDAGRRSPAGVGPAGPAPGTIGTVLGIAAVTIALAIYAQAQRYRRFSTPVQRQQTKWVVYGLALQFALMLVTI